MFNEKNVLCAEVLLAKFFTENSNLEWHPVRIVLIGVKFQGISKSEFKEARKRLAIESKAFDGEYHWKWSNDNSPEKVWEDKSKELFKG